MGEISIIRGEVVGEVCVCLECKWLYLNDEPFECENPECSRYGKKGLMCKVVMEVKTQ